MRQVAKVIKVEGEIADVEIQRHTACKKCGGCNLGTDKTSIVQARNLINAQAGQKVYLSMENMSVLKAASIMYMIPLFFMILGVMFAYLCADKFGYQEAREMWSLVFGGAFLLGTFIIIKKLEPKFSKNNTYSPEIVDFASEDAEE